MNFQFFKDLIGSWKFERTITNPQNHIKGKATFVKRTDTQLEYHETGTYNVNNIDYDFFQKRFFVLEEKNLLIYKVDGSILHTFENTNYETYPLALSHCHNCNSDRYNCSLIFLNKQIFEMNYVIFGDHKNYQIQTTYIKHQ